MRIALVVAGGVDRSGRERVIPALLWLIERLARRHAVHVFALRHGPVACDYPLLGARVHDLGRATGPAGTRSLFQTRHLVRALRAAGPFDVLHGYWAVPSGMLAALAGRRLGIPVVVTFDSGELVAVPDIGYGLQATFRGRRAVALTARLATRLHVCSQYMARLAKDAGLSVDRIPLGVDAGIFRPGNKLADGPPWRLLHVASLNRVKDQTTLLGALTRVVSRRDDVHLDVVGEDTLDGHVQRETVMRGLARHVTFHGFQPTDQIAAFYRRAHLLVSSSRHEAAGVAVLEAAASGVPTVGTAVGYVADWAPTGAWGVAAGDESGLADGILTLLGDRDRRANMARVAHEFAVGHDADWTTRAIERLYNSC